VTGRAQTLLTRSLMHGSRPALQESRLLAVTEWANGVQETCRTEEDGPVASRGCHTLVVIRRSKYCRHNVVYFGNETKVKTVFAKPVKKARFSIKLECKRSTRISPVGIKYAMPGLYDVVNNCSSFDVRKN